MVAKKPAWIYHSHFKQVPASKSDQPMEKWTVMSPKDSLQLKIAKYN